MLDGFGWVKEMNKIKQNWQGIEPVRNWCQTFPHSCCPINPISTFCWLSSNYGVSDGFNLCVDYIGLVLVGFGLTRGVNVQYIEKLNPCSFIDIQSHTWKIGHWFLSVSMLEDIPASKDNLAAIMSSKMLHKFLPWIFLSRFFHPLHKITRQSNLIAVEGHLNGINIALCIRLHTCKFVRDGLGWKLFISCRVGERSINKADIEPGIVSGDIR